MKWDLNADKLYFLTFFCNFIQFFLNNINIILYINNNILD